MPPCGGHPEAMELRAFFDKCFKSCPRVGGIIHGVAGLLYDY